MSNELLAILLVGVLLAVADVVMFFYGQRVLRDIQRMQRAVAGLVVH
jgi:hypothetical protein